MTAATKPEWEMHTPQWMVLAQAYERMGILEIPGAAAHPMITKFFTHTSLKGTKLAKSDETAWCSAFACTCLEEAGFRSPRSAAARSWLKWGILLPIPQIGCIVVFDRADATNKNAAHVAFYVDDERGSDRIKVLGGNQKNRVCVAPYKRSEILGFRWPVKP